jgi:hypothetical protein
MPLIQGYRDTRMVAPAGPCRIYKYLLRTLDEEIVAQAKKGGHGGDERPLMSLGHTLRYHEVRKVCTTRVPK